MLRRRFRRRVALALAVALACASAAAAVTGWPTGPPAGVFGVQGRDGQRFVCYEWSYPSGWAALNCPIAGQPPLSWPPANTAASRRYRAVFRGHRVACDQFDALRAGKPAGFVVRCVPLSTRFSSTVLSWRFGK